MSIEAPTRERSTFDIGCDISSRLREFSTAVAEDCNWLDQALDAYRNANNDGERDRAVDLINDRVRTLCAEVLSMGGCDE